MLLQVSLDKNGRALKRGSNADAMYSLSFRATYLEKRFCTFNSVYYVGYTCAWLHTLMQDQKH